MRPDTNLETDILAAVLHDPEQHARVLLATLDLDDFTTPATKAMFAAIQSVAKRDGHDAIAPATVRDELRRSGADDRDVIGLLDPDLGLGPVGSFEPKCRRLREIRQQRTFEQQISHAMQQGGSPNEMFERVRDISAEISALTPQISRSFADFCDDMIAEIEYDMQHEHAHVKTGVPTLDKYLRGGFRGGWLIVMGARTGVGKTMFAVQIVTKAAAMGRNVLYFAIEESPTQIVERVIRYHQHIASSVKLQDQMPVIRAALEDHVRSLPIEVLRQNSLEAIVSIVGERVLRREGVGLVAVDYAGLVRPAGHYESKVQEIAEVTQTLKLAAMEYRVPIMLMAQINRSPMARTDRRPQLSDLKDSGSLEQDGDVVLLLHHDAEDPTKDVLRLAKNRYGPPGDLPVNYNYVFGRVEEEPRI